MTSLDDLPWRGPPAARPDLGVPLPGDRMPLLRGGRPLKRWRWVGLFAEEAMVCVATARVGPGHVEWWAVWDRAQRTLAEHTTHRRGSVTVGEERVRVHDGPVAVDLALELGASEAVETISRHGAQYAWTAKRGGVPMRGTVSIGDRRIVVDGRGVVDDSAGYHARRTAWRWSAGVGETEAGAAVAWNLVDGLHDAAEASERSVWVDGVAHEVGPVAFAPDLAGVAFAEGGRLAFTHEAARTHREELLIASTRYEQPFGTFAGELPGAGRLRAGRGVMERHEARW